MKKKMVVLTGAGISAESGFQTFRDAGGLWENNPIEAVATPEGWARDHKRVTNFYNDLRAQLLSAQPNAGHLGLVDLEELYDVCIITQNIDDLHERAGSSKVIHLHGELMKVCSSNDPNNPRYQEALTPERIHIDAGEKAKDGSLLRPWIVWFGEAVPNMTLAEEEVKQADIFVVIGSSLNVYPAAGLIHYAPSKAHLFLIDPKEVQVPTQRNITFIQKPATKGVPHLKQYLIDEGL